MTHEELKSYHSNHSREKNNKINDIINKNKLFKAHRNTESKKIKRGKNNDKIIKKI